jgi:hypothetical protein
VAVIWTTSDTEAVCWSVPLVAVTVSGKEPGGVVAAVATVNTDDCGAGPLMVIVGGTKLAVASAGKPVAVRLMVPVNPPEGIAVIV